MFTKKIITLIRNYCTAFGNDSADSSDSTFSVTG